MCKDMIVEYPLGYGSSEYHIDGKIHNLTGAIVYLRSLGFHPLEIREYLRLLPISHRRFLGRE